MKNVGGKNSPFEVHLYNIIKHLAHIKDVHKKGSTYILNSRAPNIGNKILWIHIYLKLVKMILVHAKKIWFGNDLAVVFGHLRPGVENYNGPLAGQ